LALSCILIFMCLLFLLSSWSLGMSLYGYLYTLLVLRGVCVIFYYISCIAYEERDRFLDSYLLKNLLRVFSLLILYHVSLIPLFRGVHLNHIYINYFGIIGVFLILYLFIRLIIAVKVSKYIISPSRFFKSYGCSLN